MINIRKSNERGGGDHGWLKTHHTFSFGDYFDPEHTQFRSLRVMNEDFVTPGKGFDMHGHRDMEIVTVVLAGALEHRDSLGNGEVLRPGEVQRMTAGTGIRHSEFNPSPTEPVHLYQVWIQPRAKGLKPSYEQRAFPIDERRGRLRIVASPDGRDGSVTIQQDAELHLAALSAGQKVQHKIAPGRHAWVQCTRGTMELNGQRLTTGDGAALSEEPALELRAIDDAEAIVFDLE